ncbi:MAG: peptide chain release factor N(5)-glutamine methyltransferase [Bacteroidales bacterium]|nr:peptide chain release factor N(5)-glutamine methyltransferase [Bacteroidales bacterium]
MPMLLADFIRQTNESLAASFGKGEASSITALLCEKLLGADRFAHILDPLREVPETLLPVLEDAVDRLLANEPVQYILGKAQFCGSEFNVNPSVLIPRQETEMLCKLASEFLEGREHSRVHDLCTGSGCIAWTVASRHPYARVTGVDISPAALGTAASQPFRLPNAPGFVMKDVLDVESLESLGPCELLLSNPPYVRESEKASMAPNVLEHEPSLALFVADSDPLVFYRAIAEAAAKLLVPGGCCIVEINEAFGEETAALFRSAGLGSVSVLPDLCSKDRFVRAEKSQL